MKQHARCVGNRALCGYHSKMEGDDILADYDGEDKTFKIEKVQLHVVYISCKNCQKVLKGFGIENYGNEMEST